MGARVYVLSKNEYSNILGIFTNFRQCRKFIIIKLDDEKDLIVTEIRLNEPEKGRKDITGAFYKDLEAQRTLAIKQQEWRERKAIEDAEKLARGETLPELTKKQKKKLEQKTKLTETFKKRDQKQLSTLNCSKSPLSTK